MINEENYADFLCEAQELLQNIEEDLFALKEDASPARIHSLMRYAHTLKGAAASVGLEIIQKIAHVLEDVFKNLYKPEVIIDDEIEALLMQGYECLRLPLMAHFNGTSVDESSMLDRAANTIAKLQEKLGDCFDRDAPIPTSEELGFDVIKSIFEKGIEEKIQEIENASPQDLESVLRQKSEVFLGIAESFGLPGFGEIAATTINALNNNGDRLEEIAKQAIEDFRVAQKIVLDGDRSSGGFPSPTLQALARTKLPSPTNIETPIVASEKEPVSLSMAFESVDLEQNITNTNPLPLSTAFESVDLDAKNSNNNPVPLSTAFESIDLDAKNSNNNPTENNPIPLATAFESVDLEQNIPNNNPLPLSTAFESVNLDGNIANNNSTDNKPVPLANAFESIDLDGNISNNNPTENNPVPLSMAFESVNLEDNIDRGQDNKKQSENDSSLSLQELFASSTVEKNKINSNNNTRKEDKEKSDKAGIEKVKKIEQITATKSKEKGLVTKAGNKKSRKYKDSRGGSVRVAIEQLERLNHITGELLINQNQQNNQDEQLRIAIQELLAQFREHQHNLNELLDWSDSKWIETEQWSGNKQYYGSNELINVANFDVLEMDRYSDLQLIVKRTIEQTMQLEAIAETIAAITKQSILSREAQQRQLTHLRDDLTTARMQPLGALLNRFPPLLKQLTRANNKKAELVLIGTEVLVDKAIVEKLYDPLLHLVRNAFDHGVETPEKRLDRDKPETGKIEIKAYHQGNRTTIEVKDDGNGINTEKIANRAIEMDLITPQQLQGMTPYQIQELLFEPGFSTADKLTDLSGRGVGLDVVRSQLQAIEGSVTINSIPTKGTTFSLQIPLSLTITELLICKAKGIAYALPVDTVEQIIIPQSNQLAVLGKNLPANSYESNSQPQGISRQVVLRWQQEQGQEETLVPVHKLSELIEYSNLSSRFLGANHHNSPLMATEGLLTQHSPVVLLRTSNGLSGLQVEQILGEKELVLRPLGDTVNPPPYIYGCCILSSSRLALAIDIEKLIEHKTTSHQTANRGIAGIGHSGLLSSAPRSANKGINSLPPSRNKDKSIVLLVVDDSLTLRRSLSRTLQKFGYQVHQAADGQEALELLQRDDTVNLIVCDVEMPRVNGFEFLNKIRQYPNLNDIPVVMLTSRGGSKYRQIASELGASAYLTKPYSEPELMSTLTEILD